MVKITPVELSGTYREQGRQHGEALAPVIAEIMGEVLTWSAWDDAKVEALLGQVEANLRRWAPWMVEEMQGIAEGSALPYRDILAYNALADIWQVQAFCTTIGWADTPAGAIIGKTNDIGRDHEKYHWPFIRRGGEGHPAVCVTWPGTVWANCFVNESGLAFGGSSLGLKARNPEGIPSNCMLRVPMDTCGTVAEAIEALRRIPVMHHPAHIVFADATGDLAGVEMTPEGVQVCMGPRAPHALVTNHFCPGPWEGQDSGEARHVENSQRRRANLERLTRDLPHTVEGMQQVVCDHADSGAICQHGQEDMWSSTGYVAIPSERAILIAHGQPCEGAWGRVGL